MSSVIRVIRRMAAMPPGELLYRVSRRATLTSLRARSMLRLGAPFPASYELSRYAFCTDIAPRLPSLPWASVTAATEGRMPSVHSQWHAADDTGQIWPLRFFTHIDHPPGNPIGDAQLAWTRSRLQDLVMLGLLCRESSNETVQREAGAQVGRLLLSWLKQNPWLQGIHYQSTMECALRLIASCHAFDLARAHIPSESWQGLLCLVHSHAYFIERRLCLYTSAGNHTIGECAGLVYAGVLFPELADAQRWLRVGLQHLEREAQFQILEDGGNREHAFRYLAMITDLCGLVTSLLRHVGHPVPQRVEQAWLRGMAFLRSFADDPAALPTVGDSDDGYALSPYLRLSWQPGAGLAQPTTAKLKTFSVSGYSTICAPPAHGTMHFIHGALGVASGFGHGHADALSVWWERNGRALLVDPGTYLYEGEAKFRHYFRGTAAHNTIVVDGLDQAQQEQGSTFNWSRPYSAELVWHRVGQDGNIVLLARHNGYAVQGVTHWRALIYDVNTGWVIWDRVDGKADHTLDLHWHVDASLAPDGDGFIVSDAGSDWCLAVAGGDASIHRGDASAPLGWISRKYGTREPLNTLKVRARTPLPHEFVTTLSAGKASAPTARVDHPLIAMLRERCLTESRDHGI